MFFFSFDVVAEVMQDRLDVDIFFILNVSIRLMRNTF